MLALTLRHPWVWAIVALGKDIENRRWKPRATSLAKGDWFAIHGGVRPRERSDAWSEMIFDRDRIRQTIPLDPERTELAHTTTYNDSIREGIVAVARFGGVVTQSDSPWFAGPIAWVLEQVWALPEPIACRGAQGLWEIPSDVHQEIRRQWREAVRAEQENATEEACPA